MNLTSTPSLVTRQPILRASSTEETWLGYGLGLGIGSGLGWVGGAHLDEAANDLALREQRVEVEALARVRV